MAAPPSMARVRHGLLHRSTPASHVCNVKWHQSNPEYTPNCRATRFSSSTVLLPLLCMPVSRFFFSCNTAKQPGHSKQSRLGVWVCSAGMRGVASQNAAASASPYSLLLLHKLHVLSMNSKRGIHTLCPHGCPHAVYTSQCVRHANCWHAPMY